MLIADRYEPTGASACGGMGEVHKCVDRHLGRDVMLKKMRQGKNVARLIDEQKALVKLRSKHVVQLLDIIVVDGNFGSKDVCLALEHIDGRDLQEGSWEPNEDFIKALWQVASGLADIHEAGIIHRDIKPNNMRVDGEGVIKILDFGLAREAGKDDKTRSIIGTVGYMAPELWGEKTISFSSAVDAYAFGVMALALLNRTLPKEFSQSPPAPVPSSFVTSHIPEFSREISCVIQDCLSHDVAHRPSLAQVRDILARYILKDRHRARMVMGSTVYEINSGKRDVNLKSPIGNLHVHYDGFSFSVRSASGEVWINNGTPKEGMKMPPACVITFGGSQRRNRHFLTFDVSNPEVMA
ncbi:MAG: serine/threonine protein kinase [Rhodospirillales bacterium]|nr:serine/threonine protein kinase [Rhodospirillales bacterium]